MRQRFLLLRAGSAAAIAIVIVLAVVLLTGGSSRPVGDRSGRAAESSLNAEAVHCRPGTVAADGPLAHNHRACVRMGQPETFADLGTANSQLGARDNAPFVSAPAGAFRSAYAHRLAMAVAHADGATGTWNLAGTPPECAAPTDHSATCPAPNADNGNYGYTGPLGFRTLTGRITSFAYDPSSQGRYFASPTAGGIWETLNGGSTWHSIGDSLPTQVVGAIAYDAPLHRIIVGTGDNSFGGTGIAGHGVYYSDDDGASWQLARGVPDLSLSFRVVVSPVDTSGSTIYAATSKGLFRSGDGGVSYVNEKLPTSPPGYSPNCAGDTTSRLCFFANDVTDVIVKPTGIGNALAGAVIAAVGWRAGQKIDKDANNSNVSGCTQNGAATPCLQAPQNGLYESNTGAPGSFAHLAPGTGGVTGLPPTAVQGRTALAVAHGAGQNSDAVYAIVEDAQKFNGCPDVLDQTPPPQGCNSTATGAAIATVLDGMYASYDFGKSWTKIMDSAQLKQAGTGSALIGEAGYNPGIQSWYNLWVEADPTSTDTATHYPTRVLFGLEEIWENNQVLPLKTGPGGALTTPFTAYPGGTPATDPWVVIGRYWNACGGVNNPVGPCNPSLNSNPIPGSTTHPDQHAAAMIPDGRGGVTLLAGSDGGVYSQHVNSGQDFSNDNWGDGLNATISAVQPYDAEMAKDGTIVSGLQDNGEMKTAPNGREAEIYGGDAFYTTIDPDHSANIIEEYTYAGQVNLSKDGGASWYSISPSSSCGSGSTALFSTPIEQDPTMTGHLLVGCTQIQEATDAYANPCAPPQTGADASTCQTTNSPFNTVYDLSTLPSPNHAPNIPSALAVRGANAYVGYCGYCDTATQGIPFANGIATNVGGSAPPKIGTGDGWHKASALCSGCQTADGRLPQRYITSIQEDPADPNTVYVTLGGYERRWIPPGSFGEDTSNVGVGHLFVSHDHGEHFTNITGNLPDIPANWTAFHDGQVLVATDLGVYLQSAPGSTSWSVLGDGLPNAPVFTTRASPGNSDLFLAATYGRGAFFFGFNGARAPGSGHPNPNGSGSGLNLGTFAHGGSRCTRPVGRLRGARLGAIALGETRAKARRTLRRLRVTHYGFDDFCLRNGYGIRVGYPSPRLLSHQPRRLRRRLSGRVVFALTANRYYALRGIRPGARARIAIRRLHAHGSFTVGVNRWYLISAPGVTEVLKVRRGVVQEIGIADLQLTSNAAADRRFLTSFRAD